jgi:hypothetical protein
VPKNDAQLLRVKRSFLLGRANSQWLFEPACAGLMQTLISETGLDLKQKFKTEKQFVSWLHLYPNNKVSDGKILSRKTRHYHNALKTAFRDAANTMSKSKNQLGEFFRMIQKRKGHHFAVTATARKVAVIIYKMLTEGQQFKPQLAAT